MVPMTSLLLALEVTARTARRLRPLKDDARFYLDLFRDGPIGGLL